MAQPTPFVRTFDFSDFQQSFPDQPLPGGQLDIEINNIGLSLTETQDNLGAIQRDDGMLANDSVGMDQLDTEGIAFVSNFKFRGDWQPDTQYFDMDVIRGPNGSTFIAEQDHQSDPADFNNDRPVYWYLFANPASATGAPLFAAFDGNAASTAFALPLAVADEKQILVFVDGGSQDPENAYIVSGATLTFAAPPPLGVRNILVFGIDLASATAAATAEVNATSATASAAAAAASEAAAASSEAIASASETTAVAAANSIVNQTLDDHADVVAPSPSAGDSLIFNGTNWVPGVARFTGEEIMYAGSTPPTGWVRANGSTIGDPGSGASRSNVDTEALFKLLWAAHEDVSCPMFNSFGVATPRGVSSEFDWTAGRRMSTPNYSSRSALGSGQGDGLTLREHGATGGEEAHVQTVNELAPHSHGLGRQSTGSSGSLRVDGPRNNNSNDRTTSSAGSGVPANVMHPYRVTNFIIKL